MRTMNAAAVNEIVAEMRAKTKSKAARIGMARNALRLTRDLTPCGRKAWEDFLKSEGVSA